MKEVTVTLTARELTLVRVSMLTRLDRLRHLYQGGIGPKDEALQRSYRETKELMCGKLWRAVREVSDDVR